MVVPLVVLFFIWFLYFLFDIIIIYLIVIIVAALMSLVFFHQNKLLYMPGMLHSNLSYSRYATLAVLKSLSL
jgi:hypothetical protein